MAAGTARLGLRSALITRVGDEHMGRFIREELAREGVDARGVKTDPDRLTALVLLGIRDEDRFPLIFYRENCADMALCEDDIDPAFIAEARAVVATGTHLSHPKTEAAVLKALRLAREVGARTALDIDYRPNLWGLSGHGDGENRFVEKRRRDRQAAIDAASVRPDRRHRGRVSHRRRHDRHYRRAARGARGVCRHAGLQARRRRGGGLCGGDPRHAGRRRGRPRLPDRGVQRAWRGRRLHVGPAEGLAGRCRLADRAEIRQCLRGLRGQPPWLHPRLSAAGPSCSSFLPAASGSADLRNDAELEQVHWATNRHGDWSTMRVFAFDHRMQLEAMAGATPARIGALQGAVPAGRAAGGRMASPATASSATTAWGATRCTRRRAPACGSGGRWNGPARAR